MEISPTFSIDPAELLDELLEIRSDMIRAAEESNRLLDRVHPARRDSAINLLQYLVLRRQDLRPLQHRLAALGLSSLGRSESHVLAAVEAVIENLGRMTDRPASAFTPQAPVDFHRGQRLLTEHADALLGPAPENRNVRIMVTLPSEAADSGTLIRLLLRQGMDCIRINCAHDDAETWSKMIEHLRAAEQALGRTCRVVMDLAGPKLRTGPIQSGPRVLKLRPRRDLFGRVTQPARIRFAAKKTSPPGPDPEVIVSPEWLAAIRPGDRISCIDARGARRYFNPLETGPDHCLAETNRTTYFTPETVLVHRAWLGEEQDRSTPVSGIPAQRQPLRLYPGDLLLLTRNLEPGIPAERDETGRLLSPARIGCTLPEVFEDVRQNETIWFDDGKIGGVIDRVETEGVLVRITHARLDGENLREDKGINLPDSRLSLSALTSKDLEDLDFIARHADIVELSFVSSVQDIDRLHEHLAACGDRQPAVVLKIETRRAFESLPAMLLAAMRMPVCGVMIARGDLAVECGFERLAEIQEEILWICEAAHVPVIWATQVLENLAKNGIASRAEITDAAMGHRAECVMLNKGPHMASAIRVLDDILKRMQSHQNKKRPMMRALQLARTSPG